MLDLSLFLGMCLSAVAIASLLTVYFGLCFIDWALESGLYIVLVFAFLIYLDYIY